MYVGRHRGNYFNPCLESVKFGPRCCGLTTLGMVYGRKIKCVMKRRLFPLGVEMCISTSLVRWTNKPWVFRYRLISASEEEEGGCILSFKKETLKLYIP